MMNKNIEIETLLTQLLLACIQPFIESNGLLKRSLPAYYKLWLDESISVLVDEGYLCHQDNGGYACTEKLVELNVLWSQWDQKKKYWCEDVNQQASIRLVETCLRALPDILAGKKQATDVIFPNSSVTLVEGIYRNNAVSDQYNAILANVLTTYLQTRIRSNASCSVRILEIGAGTGGTTAGLLPVMAPYQSIIKEYCYTDLSKAFLLHAEEQYAPKYTYLKTSIFDVSQPLFEQGIEEGGYDVVIAANVLHATQNIRLTLRNTKAALCQGGILLLNELSKKSLFAHLTFGLLKGWWLYKDSSLRIPGSPGLYPATWKQVLSSEGFNAIQFPAQKMHASGQQIIVAQSDGVVRKYQKIQRSTTKKNNSLDKEYCVVSSDLQKTNTSQEIQLSSINEESLKEKSAAYLKNLVAETLKMQSQQIDSSQPLELYGLDSILVVQLTDKLRKAFDNISSTLFFEVQTVDALVDHLLKTQKNSLIRQLDFKTTSVDDKTTSIISSNQTPASLLSQRINKPRRFASRLTPHDDSPIDTSAKTSSLEGIAVIGLSGRYANTNNVDEFWQQLSAGNNCITEIPQQRWDWEKYFDAEKGKAGKSYSKWGGFIQDVDKFDPLFFNISPLEAEQMDPQERLFLEEAYKSIQDAGYTPDTLSESRSVGIFVGAMNSDYGRSTSYWSIANRLSYLFNFQGPSIALDTACSSSLTAIHLAIESLNSGASDCVIAGGVNLILDPIHYLGLSEMTMLSATSTCKPFGDAADGFIDGEGIGAVVLKSLGKAIDDGDRIYGVLKGSAVNHDGKTNGYTVPNPHAQQSVISQALKKANIHPRSISYIEAHGTGTKLGDPIEITGLTKAFSVCEEKQYCAIGSVKSNIGHCESAAGIAGLTKILLQLKYKQLVPSLHSQILNSNIDFAQTPFEVNQMLRTWEAPTIDGNPQPRIAGLSSFGAGGSNAHLLIEEYSADNEGSKNETAGHHLAGPYLILLSAKTAERLNVVASDLELHLNNLNPDKTNKLFDIAYTLQVGREAMDERLGFIVNTQEELQQKLKDFLAGNENTEGVYRDQVKRNKKALAVFMVDEDFQLTIDKWIERGKYYKLLDLWVKGLTFDWHKLYKYKKPKRVSLPTYPFVKERYWIEAQQHSVSHQLHPLLHENTSDLSEQRFSSIFSGDEFFLKDHQVQGQKVLPGVAYLEMAQTAIRRVAGEPEQTLQFKNIVWSRPMVVGDEPLTVHTSLYPEDDQIAYEVYTENSLEDQQGSIKKESVIHSQGLARFKIAEVVAPLDLTALQARMGQHSLTAAESYSAFTSLGLAYGASYQGLNTVYVGDDEVLAKLILPASVLDTLASFTLHPSIIDAALQASIGLNSGELEEDPSVPFSLDHLEIFSACNTLMWSWVRYSKGSSVSDKVQKLDIDICNDQGVVCVRLRGFTSRVLGAALLSSTASNVRTLLLRPSWQEQTITTTSIKYKTHYVFLCGLDVTAKALAEQLPQATCIDITLSASTLEDKFQQQAVQIFLHVRTLLEEPQKNNLLIQLLLPNYQQAKFCTALSGLLKSAQSESSKIMAQVLMLDSVETAETLCKKLQENSQDSTSENIRYEGDKRFVRRLVEVFATEKRPLPTPLPVPWKEKGVYLITGGMGGLGLIFAEAIVSSADYITLVLTGRSTLSKTEQEKLEALRATGITVSYRQVDVTDRQSVIVLLENIIQEFGALQGILHSAGVTDDNFIVKKTVASFKQVLAPKVAGTVYLDEASQAIALDFFILFSSMVGELGNAGQSDYATANGFMDDYAHYRNRLVEDGQRYGQTMSINWPLWQKGGMKVDVVIEQSMMQATGMVPMQTDSGINALVEGLAYAESQVLVIEGVEEKLYEWLGDTGNLSNNILEEDTFSDISDESTLQFSKEGFSEQVVDYLKNQLAPVFKLPAHRMQPDEPLERYGIDSVMAMHLTNLLEATFGSLPSTLFFEFQTINALRDYFIESYRPKLLQLLKKDALELNQVKAKIVFDDTPHSSTLIKRKRFSTASKAVDRPANINSLDVAVIGLSGKYPQSDNLDVFWKNLQEGKDCITEIPPERWDWRKYCSEPCSQTDIHRSKWGGFITDIDKFDPLFFNVPAQEAAFIDPQVRLFLETVWMLFESAGYTRETLSKQYQSRVGTYVGAMYQQYEALGSYSSEEMSMVSSSYSAIANRISYFFDFQGPSIAIDTMCSSSLNAVHMACQDLIRGECQLAIAGGVNLSIHPKKYSTLSKAQLMGSSFKSRSFTDGDGFLPAEGVGAVLLKPLSTAIEDKDKILAVIKSTASNHSGSGNGYSTPNPNAQINLIEDNFKKSGINPRTISYVESAANGSQIGDAIEVRALTKAFAGYTQDKQFCSIGSVKSNIGHAEAASGISQLTKVVLQLQYKKLVPSIKADPINPGLDFSNSPFFLQQNLQTWERPVIKLNGLVQEYPRRATVSAFGSGGSNAHIILEEYTALQSESDRYSPENEGPELIIFSARTKEQLRITVSNFERYLIKNKEPANNNLSSHLNSIAYTLQIGREAMDIRLAVIVNNQEELTKILAIYSKSATSGSHIDCDMPFYTNSMDDDLESLMSEDNGDAVLQRLLAKNDLKKLALYWVRGGEVPWALLHEGKAVNRVLLPTYPFERRSYWINQNAESHSLCKDENITTPVATINNLKSDLPSIKPRPRLNFEAPSNDIEKSVALIWKEIFSVEEVGRHDSFFDLGGDSLLVKQLVVRLREEFHVDISVHILFEATTVAEIAEEITQTILSHVDDAALDEALSIVENLT